MRQILRGASCALALAAAAGPVEAQMLGGSARAAGLSDAYGAVARGIAAVFYNPANLGLPGNPSIGFQLPQVSVRFGTSPVTLSDIDRYGGQVVPDDVKQEWLSRIPQDGTMRGTLGTTVSAMGLSFGSIAVTTGMIGEASLALPRDAVEVFLFGNGGQTGAPQEFTLTNGGGRGFAVGFVAAGFGMPVATLGPKESPRIVSVGVTGKYLAAGVMTQMWDAGGTLTADPITAELRFPALTVWNEDRAFESKGWGADLGIAIAGPKLSLGLTVTDIVNTFEWDRESVDVRDGRAFVSEDSSSGTFDETALTDPALPAELRDSAEARLADAVFKPALRASAAYQYTPSILLVADLVHRTGDERSLQGDISTAASAGVEWRLIKILPLRVGGTLFDGGTGWSVGTGLELGLINVNVGYGQHNGDTYDDQRLSVGVAFGSGR